MKLPFRQPFIWFHKFSFAILILLNINGKIIAELTCHQCEGINCMRTNYKATQKCLDSLDICATVFEGQTVVAQGCLQQLSKELRDKCSTVEETNNQDSEILSECFKCNEYLCNNLASESFQCVQCDSSSDENCRSKAESLKPTRCHVARTPNEYCFVKREGEIITRGCSYSLEEQIECLSSEDCMICQPSQISGCNAKALTVNDSKPGGSGNDNGATEGGSDNGESGYKPEDDSSSGTAGGNGGSDSGNSGTGNENSGNDNNNHGSQDESSESGEGSNRCSITIVNSYIYILCIGSYYVFARK